MNRAYSIIELKSYDEDSRTITGLATTPKTDRMDDIVEPEGAEYKLPIPLLWQHRGDSPIGHVTSAKVTKKGIEITAQIESESEPGELKNLLDKAWQSIRKGLVRGLSIGFRPIETSDIDGTWGRRFIKWEWLELSAVTIPANAEATIASVKQYDEGAPAASGTGDPPRKPGASGKPVHLIKQQPGARSMKTYTEQIKDFEATRAAKEARRAEIQKAATEAGRTKDEAEREEFDTLGDEIKAIDAELRDLRELEKSAVASAKPVDGTDGKKAAESRDPAPRIVVAERKLDQGIRFARMVKCVAWAHRKHRDVEGVAKEMYPDDVLVQKASVAAGTTAAGNWAAGLVSEEGAVFADFVEFLRPQTILGKFGQGNIPSLRATDFRVPLVTQTAGGDGYWVGEGKAKPLTKFGFSRRVLLPLKVANIAVLSEENIRASSPKSDIVVRDSLAAALRQRLDIDFINPDKAEVEGVSPASILYGITPIGSSGTDADAVRADLGALLGAFIAANNPPTSAVVIMPAITALTLSLMRNALGQREFPDITMNGGMLEGLPVITSENVTSDDYGSIVAIVNASDIYLADDGGIAVDTSREASLEMDDEPAHNSGTPTPAQLVSMFQTNSVAIRAEREINWARRRDSAVQWLSDVLWAA